MQHPHLKHLGRSYIGASGKSDGLVSGSGSDLAGVLSGIYRNHQFSNVLWAS